MGYQSSSNMSDYRGIEGLGGWLAILQIVLYSSIIWLGMQLIVIYSMMNGETWPVVAFETSEFFVAEWRTAYNALVWSSLLQLGIILYVLLMLYGKKRFLPKLMIVYFPAMLLLCIGNLLLFNRAEEALALAGLPEAIDTSALSLDKTELQKKIVRSVVGCAIWIPYFLKSDRVENTFLR